MGPTAVRIAGLRPMLEKLGYEVFDWGDVAVAIPEIEEVGDRKARYLPTVAGTCREVSGAVEEILNRGAFPLVVGGDHSVAIGTFAGISSHLDGGTPGVLWFDAHSDINTPSSSPSGNIHGMPVACALGDGPPELTSIGHDGPKINPRDFVQIGLRDIDPMEKERLRQSGIHSFTMADIDRMRISTVVERGIELATANSEHLHVSFDIDVLDPTVAPGTGTPKNGGLTYREAHLALEMVAASGRLRSFEIVEVNPAMDMANQTARLAVGLVASALGKTIL